MSYVNISGAGVFGRRTLGGLGAAPSVSVQQAVSAIEAIDPSTKAQVDLDPSNPDWINQLLTTYVDSFGGAKAFVSMPLATTWMRLASQSRVRVELRGERADRRLVHRCRQLHAIRQAPPHRRRPGSSRPRRVGALEAEAEACSVSYVSALSRQSRRALGDAADDLFTQFPAALDAFVAQAQSGTADIVSKVNILSRSAAQEWAQSIVNYALSVQDHMTQIAPDGNLFFASNPAAAKKILQTAQADLNNMIADFRSTAGSTLQALSFTTLQDAVNATLGTMIDVLDAVIKTIVKEVVKAPLGSLTFILGIAGAAGVGGYLILKRFGVIK